MVTRRVALALAVLLVPVGAWADRHKAGAGGGPRAAGGSTLWGIGLSGDWTLWGEMEPNATAREHRGTVSLVGEGNWVHGKHEGRTQDQFTVLGGLRYTLNDFPHPRLELFGQTLAGWFFGGGSDSAAGSFGIGADWVFSDSGHGWGLRFQYDRSWIEERAETWYDQATIAVIYRFPHLDRGRR
jgi:hypothetical protein